MGVKCWRAEWIWQDAQQGPTRVTEQHRADARLPQGVGQVWRRGNSRSRQDTETGSDMKAAGNEARTTNMKALQNLIHYHTFTICKLASKMCDR